MDLTTTVTLNDFDITYYPGLTAQDVIPKLIKNLKLTFGNLPKDSIQYKAIKTYIRLLKNYLAISNTSSTLTSETISIFNMISEYLMNYSKEKYPQYDIHISPNGRIKSPISANTKIKEKISKYMKDKKDLDTLEIRDFIAFRFIVEVRDFFGNLIPEPISVDICYDIINEAIKFMNDNDLIRVLPISDSSKPEPNNQVSNNIYHPLVRPDYIKENDMFIKDFIYSPKPNTEYQSVHLQFEISLPDCQGNTLGELQFRTFLMNEHAEHGPASHTSYKSREKASYLAVPQLLVPIKPYSQQVAFLEPDEAFEKFLGFSPKQINPSMGFNYLKSFLEDINYSYPVLPLAFKRDEKNNVFFYDDFTCVRQMPLEIVGSQNTEELFALVGDIFDEKTIEIQSEHEFI